MSDKEKHNASPDRYTNSVGYNFCGKSGLKLPRLSLGLWHNFGDVDDATEALKMSQCTSDEGITQFDLANNCGSRLGSSE